MSRNIPTMEVNNYASIFAKPIFKNQAGEWYRDVGYRDSVDIIHENFKGAAKSFIAIGYYLKHMKKINYTWKEITVIYGNVQRKNSDYHNQRLPDT